MADYGNGQVIAPPQPTADTYVSNYVLSNFGGGNIPPLELIGPPRYVGPHAYLTPRSSTALSYVWNGSQWLAMDASARVWNGSAWVPWVGTQVWHPSGFWVTIK